MALGRRWRWAHENRVSWDRIAGNLEMGLGAYLHLESGPAHQWSVDILQVGGGFTWLNPRATGRKCEP